MRLYSVPLSPYAARVRAAIYAKNLPIEIVPPPEDWRTSPSYKKLNPLVRIPTLELDDGTGIGESGVIVEYLEDKFPTPSLRPATPEALARARFITAIAELYVMPAMTNLFIHYGSFYGTATPDEEAAKPLWEKLFAALGPLNDALPHGQYAVDNKLSTADLWLTPVRFGFEALQGLAKRPGILDDYPNIVAYRQAAESHQALVRIRHEMDEALKEFYRARQAASTAS